MDKDTFFKHYNFFSRFVTFGVDHVVINRKILWTDTDTDRDKFYELFLSYCKKYETEE